MFLLKKFSINLAKDWFKSVESSLKCLNHRMLKVSFGAKMYLNKPSNDQRVAFTKFRTFYHRIENCLDPRKILHRPCIISCIPMTWFELFHRGLGQGLSQGGILQFHAIKY